MKKEEGLLNVVGPNLGDDPYTALEVIVVPPKLEVVEVERGQ